MTVEFKWNGEALKRKMFAAQKFGIDKTMAEAVTHAKNNHTWKNRTGTLEGSVKIIEYGAKDLDGVAGTWGSADVVYALIQELGGTIVPVKAKMLMFKVDGETRFAHSVTIPARPYLRPAAAAIYPRLAANIKAGARREGIGP